MGRFFTRTQRVALYLAAGGRCQDCGRVLRGDWHADHVIPYAKGGATVIENGRATCGFCNQRKGCTMPEPLRRWQQRAIAQYFTSPDRDFLLVATPGAGKTRVAAEIARQSFVGDRVDRLIVVVPTIPLRVQWADALAAHGRHVDPAWKVGDLVPPDVDGLVVTYAAVASNPMVLRRLVTERRTLAFFDEIHHCGDDDHLAWGRALLDAFDAAAWRLSLSGTPFRSDSARIPFVEYDDGVARVDHSYGYRDAITDRVCRLVFFPTLGGAMEWQFGELTEAVRIEDAGRHQERHALRTALMPDGGWIASVVDDAHRKLTEVRLTDPDAAGLIVCSDITHAERVAGVLRARARLAGHDVVVVTTDDERAPERIRAFRGAATPWIVAVRMVSEGVDIPRIRVVVWATAEKTELRFRQVVGRAVRVQDGHDDHTAWVFIPRDRELLAWAAAVAEERTHALRDEEEKITGDGERPEPARAFTPVSAEGERGDTLTTDGRLTEAEIAQAEAAKRMDPATAGMSAEQLAIFARNLARAGRQPPPEEPGGPTPHERRRALRDANNRAAAAIAMRHGIPHEIVNGRLNRSVRVRKLSGASIEQLERRLRLAAHWRDTGDDDAVAA